MFHNPVKTISIYMELVHFQFITNPQVDQQHAGQSGWKSNQVDEEHALKAFEIAKDEKDDVLDHVLGFEMLAQMLTSRHLIIHDQCQNKNFIFIRNLRFSILIVQHMPIYRKHTVHLWALKGRIP